MVAFAKIMLILAPKNGAMMPAMKGFVIRKKIRWAFSS
jgi:hypothetical protein